MKTTYIPNIKRMSLEEIAEISILRAIAVLMEREYGYIGDYVILSNDFNVVHVALDVSPVGLSTHGKPYIEALINVASRLGAPSDKRQLNQYTVYLHSTKRPATVFKKPGNWFTRLFKR